jgi:phosphatidylserine/phosphatidylglycerophosphate/cardiolipin synthase-like enzyme
VPSMRVRFCKTVSISTCTECIEPSYSQDYFILKSSRIKKSRSNGLCSAFNTISALGSTLKSEARIFVWPYAKCEATFDGKYGSLYAKIAICDNQLYISSANLTEHAMNLNMEMGNLLTGGELPEQERCHFDDLIVNGTLAEIADKQLI